MAIIAVADTSGDFRSGLAAVIAPLEGAELRAADRVESALMAEPVPHVVIVGPSLAPEEGIALARSRRADVPWFSVLIVAREPSTELLRAAMRAGVSDVLSAGDSVVDTREAISMALETAVRQRSGTAEHEAAEPAATGKVITVFSTKGGVGKTVLSTNIAVALAELGKKTALVDLDLQFGDVAIMLGLAPDRTIADAVQSFDRLDSDLLGGYLTEHSSGLKVLLAPVRPEDAETVTAGRITRILGLLRDTYDYVVVDTAATFDEVVLTALDKSCDVYAVTMMDVASIKNTRISMQKLQQLGYDNGLMHLVLNRADSKVWLEPAEVEKAVGAPIFAKIPSDRVVPRSVNKGRPVVLDEPRSDVAKALVALARDVVKTASEVKHDVA